MPNLGGGAFIIFIINNIKYKIHIGLLVLFLSMLSSTGIAQTDFKPIKFTLPASDIEKKFLRDMPCHDGQYCYATEQYYKFIISNYHDIAKIKFKFNQYNNLDKDDFNVFRYQFYRDLYLAKRITLANGQSLFDFMLKCSKGLAATDFADYDIDKSENIQFYPILRKISDGKAIEMKIRFNLKGDQVITQSLFSVGIIQDKNFLENDGLMCWHS